MEDALNKNAQQVNIPDWQGYTLDELRFNRALALVKLEAEKAKLAQKAKSSREESTRVKSVLGLTTNMFKRVSGKMTVIDYAIIGFNIAKIAMRLKRKRR